MTESSGSSQEDQVAKLRSELADLPPSADPSFDFAVPALIARFTPSVAALEHLQHDNDEAIAFSATYVRLTIIARDRDYSLYRVEVDRMTDRLGSVPLFSSLRAQALSHSADPGELRVALDRSRVANEKTPTRPGVLHTYASVIASLGGVDTLSDGEVAEGTRAICSAIHLAPPPGYAKYHATYASLLALAEKWDEARREIDRAIDLEPSSGQHYAMRIADYQDTRLGITVDQRAASYEEAFQRSVGELEVIKAGFEDMRRQVIELLGLLAAVIAFLVVGTQTALQLAELRPAIALITAVSGSIIVVFSVFDLLFVPRMTTKRNVIAAACGLALMVLAWFADAWT